MLIEDETTKRVFEVHARGLLQGLPAGAGTVHNEEAYLLVGMGSVALVSASLIWPSLERIILQGETNGRLVLVSAIFTLICLVSLFGVATMVWRLSRQEQTRIIRYTFDLTEKTLTLTDTDNLIQPRMRISSKTFPSFVYEYKKSWHRVTLTGRVRYTIYYRIESPDPEFLSALTAIGVTQVESLTPSKRG